MEKIKVTICAGTACHLMGSSHIQMIEEHLDPRFKDRVEVEGVRCLDLCKEDNYSNAPFVLVNGEVVSKATLHDVLDRIYSIVENDEIS
jgi:NADH:ubiquinone oxidoreductase subunit E